MADFTDEDLAFASLVGWCGYIDPLWRAYPHLVLLCRELEEFAFAVARGEERRLAVFLPPQSGKSQVVSRAFTTWILGRWPHLRVILASYESSYAAQWGRYARDVLTQHGERVFGVRVSQGSSAADHWELAWPNRGAFHAAGLAAGITGQPCEVAVIDDPHRNRAEAESGPIRDRIVDNYKGALLTRQPRGVVNVMTRWSVSDLAGWIEDNEKHMNWRIIRMPAFAEADDILGRVPGEALCPDLRPVASLNNLKSTMSSYEWEGMFQQRPVPLGGGLFKRSFARRYVVRDGVYRFDDGSYSTIDDGGNASMPHVFVTCDTATSSKESADQTAIQAWGVSYYGKLVLLDMHMDRIEGPQIMKAIVAMCDKWKTIAWIEENSTSKHLLSFMSEQGITFRTVSAGSTNKLTRALPASGGWEQGKVFLPESTTHLDRDWLPAFEKQLFQFTGADGGKDDAVDAFAYAYRVYLEVFQTQTVFDQSRGASATSSLLPPGWEGRAASGFRRTT